MKRTLLFLGQGSASCHCMSNLSIICIHYVNVIAHEQHELVEDVPIHGLKLSGITLIAQMVGGGGGGMALSFLHLW